MLAMPLTFGDGAWPDLAEKMADGRVIDIEEIAVNVLDSGMKSGQPSVGLRIDLPDGRTVLAQTSARLFCTAAKAIMARYPDLFSDG